MSVIELFEQECSFLRKEDDLRVSLYPISEIAKSFIIKICNFINNCNINENETILLSGTNLVVTDVGIYNIKNERQSTTMNWKNIMDIYYQERRLYFKDNNRREISVLIDDFSKNNSLNYISLIGKQMASAFKKIAGVIAGNEEIYKKEFLTLPYNERKVIMPIKKHIHLPQEHITVFDIRDLPTINFPLGHPIANQLYVGHPIIPTRYIPFEDYQFELVEDKVREFCILAENLGAMEISVECLNSVSNDRNTDKKLNVDGKANTWLVDIHAAVQKDSSRYLIEKLSHSIKLHQTFIHPQKPTIPKGLIWYDNEPSWQKLVSQRLNGSLVSHEERIETKKCQMIGGRELLDIKADIKTLYANMNMTMDKTEESKFVQQENAVLSIKVKFAIIE